MNVVELTTQTFESTVAQPGIVLVDFWASWCGPCRAFSPIYERVAAQYPDATFGKLNTEENRELSSALAIRSIPTLMIFRDGIRVFNQAGMLPEKTLSEIVGKVSELDMDAIRAEIEAEKVSTAKQSPADPAP